MAVLAQLDSKITLDSNISLDNSVNTLRYLNIDGQTYKIAANTDDLRALELRIEVLENKLKTIEEKQEKYKVMYGE
jgi:hypothetical protein